MSGNRSRVIAFAIGVVVGTIVSGIAWIFCLVAITAAFGDSNLIDRFTLADNNDTLIYALTAIATLGFAGWAILRTRAKLDLFAGGLTGCVVGVLAGTWTIAQLNHLSFVW